MVIYNSLTVVENLRLIEYYELPSTVTRIIKEKASPTAEQRLSINIPQLKHIIAIISKIFNDI